MLDSNPNNRSFKW